MVVLVEQVLREKVVLMDYQVFFINYLFNLIDLIFFQYDIGAPGAKGAAGVPGK